MQPPWPPPYAPAPPPRKPGVGPKVIAALLVVGACGLAGCLVCANHFAEEGAKIRRADEAAEAAEKARKEAARAAAAAAADQRAAQADAEAITIDAGSIVSAYRGNELAADGRFRGKRVRISGRVVEVKRDIIGAPYVTLSATGAPGAVVVQCLLRSSARARGAELAPGQAITVVGTVTGLMLNVQANDCDLP
jgi:tRNA_anti-like